MTDLTGGVYVLTAFGRPVASAADEEDLWRLCLARGWLRISGLGEVREIEGVEIAWREGEVGGVLAMGEER